jgi:hypothetical protein
MTNSGISSSLQRVQRRRGNQTFLLEWKAKRIGGEKRGAV